MPLIAEAAEKIRKSLCRKCGQSLQATKATFEDKDYHWLPICKNCGSIYDARTFLQSGELILIGQIPSIRRKFEKRRERNEGGEKSH